MFSNIPHGVSITFVLFSGPLQNLYKDRLMILNRNCVLECPELDVPWFHEEYCKKKYRMLVLFPSIRYTAVPGLRNPRYKKQTNNTSHVN